MEQEQLHHRGAKAAFNLLLGSLLRWRPLEFSNPGFSIVLGVPWDLRHILSVNLRFIAATDLRELRNVHIVFDRRHRTGAEQIIEEMKATYPTLPMTFRFYDPVCGWMVERVNISTFYNSLNTVLALRDCTTKYAILHDFDLYPLRRDHFTSIVCAMRDRRLKFSGHELTFFDGLTDADRQIGTWTLGIDVEWLRANYRPIDCFHTNAVVRGRVTRLDPYAAIQFQTPDRQLAGAVDPSEFCHVKNLCSTYLRFLKQAPLKVAWRLHYLWYLESLSGLPGRLKQVVDSMDSATTAVLSVDRLPARYDGVHVTCANVLRSELSSMDRALFGAVRPEVVEYIDSFERFLRRFGDTSALYGSDGTCKWSPAPDAHQGRVAAG